MSTRSINRATIMGNLTQDPQQKSTTSGTPLVTFSVATNRSYTDQSGVKQDIADFHNFVAFGKLAEICMDLLKLGSKVLVEGRLQTRKWEGQDGKTNYRTEIVAEEMWLLANGKPKTEGQSSSSYSQSSNSSSSASSNPDDVVIVDSNTTTEEQEPKKETEKPSNKKSNDDDLVDLNEIPF